MQRALGPNITGILLYLLKGFSAKICHPSEKSLSVKCDLEGIQHARKIHVWSLGGGGRGCRTALAIVGFTWGGWHTEKAAAERAQTAVRIALIPECVRDVMADTTSAEELKAQRANRLRRCRPRLSQEERPTRTDHGYQFNRDCGKAIEAALAKIAPKS